ncbi:MAG: PEP-CTERM sorting domain-containing protein [Deltaproteobacteria bacterium]|nr:PEP-CTERM sorting domain-containing protein [Deltaproteobacteria bacterium]
MAGSHQSCGKIKNRTLGCGNDNLMGSGTVPVPEPATIILIGTGLLGIAGVGRKKLKKSHTVNG